MITFELVPLYISQIKLHARLRCVFICAQKSEVILPDKNIYLCEACPNECWTAYRNKTLPVLRGNHHQTVSNMACNLTEVQTKSIMFYDLMPWKKYISEEYTCIRYK